MASRSNVAFCHDGAKSGNFDETPQLIVAQDVRAIFRRSWGNLARRVLFIPSNHTPLKETTMSDPTNTTAEHPRTSPRTARSGRSHQHAARRTSPGPRAVPDPSDRQQPSSPPDSEPGPGRPEPTAARHEISGLRPRSHPSRAGRVSPQAGGYRRDSVFGGLRVDPCPTTIEGAFISFIHTVFFGWKRDRHGIPDGRASRSARI